MSQTCVTISGLHVALTSEEVKQKLAALYSVPEDQFDALCHSLFVSKEPHILIKKLEQSKAEYHVKRLTELGFICSSNESGLSLLPVEEAEKPEVICPACEQMTGNEEICQHCDVIIHKYLKQKRFDEKFQKEIKTSISSHETMTQRHIEKSLKDKERKDSKKKAGTRESNSHTRNNLKKHAECATTEDVIQVQSNDKGSKWIYAAVASVCVSIVGGGVAVQHVLNKPDSSDTLLVEADLSTIENSIIVQPDGPQRSSLSDSNEQAEPKVKTVFEVQLQRKHDGKILEGRIEKLVGDGRLFSAKALVSGAENPTDQLFARQKLIQFMGMSEETSSSLEETMKLIRLIENDVDRIIALLNQSDIYSRFERHEEASDVYEQATRIALNLKSREQRVLAEAAIAEHRMEYGDVEGARKRYYKAKDQAIVLAESGLDSAALAYVSSSEMDYELIQDAKRTAAIITDSQIREGMELQLSTILAKNEQLNGSAMSEGFEQETTGDEAIDNLIEMNKHNRKTLSTLSNLLD